MQHFLRSNRAAIDLTSCQEIGKGGEGRIYGLPGAALAAKIYHHPHPLVAKKLEAMIAHPPAVKQGQSTFAWPSDTIVDASGKTVGFVMPRAVSQKPVIDVYNPKERLRKSTGFHYRYLHTTAMNLASAFEAIHAAGHVIGDVNESNVLVADTTVVTLVDTDSFQITDPRTNTTYRCAVGKEQYTPPEFVGKSLANVTRAPSSDRFGLAVLIHQLLFEGAHPFDGVFGGGGPDPATSERIANGYYPFCKARSVPMRPKPLSLPHNVVHPLLTELFARCFEHGHANPDARPDARSWRKALRAAASELRPCSANANHLFGSHLNACPWCEWARRLGRDSFPPPPAPPRHPGSVPITLPAPPVTTAAGPSHSPPLSTPHAGPSAALTVPRWRPSRVKTVVRVAFAGVALATAAVAAFAFKNAKTGYGGSCTSGTECAGSLQCVNHTCSSSRQSASGHCSGSSDCDLGLVCRNSSCTSISGGPGSPCSSSSDCGIGLSYCIMHKCASERLSDGRSCESSSDCLNSCISGTCGRSGSGRSSGGIGTDCSSDSDCLPSGNHCVRHRCASQRLSDGSGCESSNDCINDCISGTCGSAPVAGSIGASCSGENDCKPRGHYCVKHKCAASRQADGSSCESTYDCINDCISGVCSKRGPSPGGIGAACSNESDCSAAGNHCVKHTCAASRQADGSSCESTNDCINDCIAGVCGKRGPAPGAVGGACSKESDCSAAGNHCVKHACAASRQPDGSSCESTWDCQNDCINGYCGRKPAPPAPTARTCALRKWDGQFRGWARIETEFCRSSSSIRGYYLRVATDEDRPTSFEAIGSAWNEYVSSFLGSAPCPSATAMVFVDKRGTHGAGILFYDTPPGWQALQQRNPEWMLRRDNMDMVVGEVCFFEPYPPRHIAGW